MQKNSEKQHIFMSQLNLHLLHVEHKLRAEYNFDLQPTVNKGYWRNFCIFLVFIMRISHIFEGTYV